MVVYFISIDTLSIIYMSNFFFNSARTGGVLYSDRNNIYIAETNNTFITGIAHYICLNNIIATATSSLKDAHLSFVICRTQYHFPSLLLYLRGQARLHWKFIYSYNHHSIALLSFHTHVTSLTYSLTNSYMHILKNII